MPSFNLDRSFFMTKLKRKTNRNGLPLCLNITWPWWKTHFSVFYRRNRLTWQNCFDYWRTQYWTIWRILTFKRIDNWTICLKKILRKLIIDWIVWFINLYTCEFYIELYERKERKELIRYKATSVKKKKKKRATSVQHIYNIDIIRFANYIFIITNK